MKKYFIDCGTNFFHGLLKFNEIYKFDNDWRIDCFEANPLTYAEASKEMPPISNINFYNKAIWIQDSHIDVNINETLPLDIGTNILKEPPAKDIVYGREFNWSRKISVPCVDLSKIISESNANFISVKLDIEGAEFEVLERLIETGTLAKIDHLFVEFHERFFISELEKYSNLKQSLISEINKQVKLFREWD